MPSRVLAALLPVMRALTFLLVALSVAPAARAATAQDLDRDTQRALDHLYEINPVARNLGRSAKAVLVFPKIVATGLAFGGADGEGEALQGTGVSGYFRSATVLSGLQLNGQSYGYAIFLMTAKALDAIQDARGWQIGVGPAVVVLDDTLARDLVLTALPDDAYAFFFNQQGLLAGVRADGTRITRIRR